MSVPASEADRQLIREAREYLIQYKLSNRFNGGASSIAFFTDMQGKNRFLSVAHLHRLLDIAAHAVGLPDDNPPHTVQGYPILRCVNWSLGNTHAAHTFEVTEEKTDGFSPTRHLYCPGYLPAAQ